MTRIHAGLAGLLVGMALAMPADAAGRNGVCSQTASVLVGACRADVVDDFLTSKAACLNEADPAERSECEEEARDERREASNLCKAQLAAQGDVCGLLGEAAYDPPFEPGDFVDPRDIGGSVAPNAYLPLIAGTRWVYEGRSEDDDGEEVVETITVVVTEETKLIEGVTCVTVNDRVEVDGVVREDTDDWFAQDIEGNVWYCGEIAQNFESFEGDDPQQPELVDIEGSFKVGRERAKPGIIMLANPQVGDAYRQEYALTEAEDVAEVIDIAGSESVPAASCSGDCVVTRDFTPLEPDDEERKFYAPGVGNILELDSDGSRVELIEFSAP